MNDSDLCCRNTDLLNGEIVKQIPPQAKAEHQGEITDEHVLKIYFGMFFHVSLHLTERFHRAASFKME